MSRRRAVRTTSVAEDPVLAHALQVSGSCVWLVLVVADVLPLLPQASALGPRMQVGMRLLLLHLVVALTGLLRLHAGRPGSRRPVGPAQSERIERRRIGWVLGDGVLLLVAIAVMAPLSESIQPQNLWALGYWALPWYLWALGALPMRHYHELLGVAVGTLVPLHLAVERRFHEPFRLLELAPLVWIAEPLVVVTVFTSVLLDAGQRRRAQIQAELQAERRRDAQRSRSEVRREAGRLLHDHVLHALHALAQDGPAVTSAMVVRDCRRAVDAIDRVLATNLMRDVADALRDDPTLAAAGLTVRQDHADPAPARAVYHLRRAVRHCVAARAQGAQPWVEVSQADRRWRVRVGGLGVPTEQATEGLGLVLTEIGGGHRPGTLGADVDLCWPADEGVASSDERSDGVIRRAMPLAAWPGMTAGLVMTLLAAPSSNRPVLVALIPLAVLAVGVRYALRLRRHPLRPWDVVVLCLVCLAGWIARVHLAPVPPVGLRGLWMATSCSSVMLLVCLQLRTHRALALAVAWTLALWAVLVHHFGPTLATGDLMATLGAGVGEMVLGVVTLGLVRMLARQDELRARRVERIRRATGELHLGSAVESHWSRLVTAQVLPALRRVAEGQWDPRDPALVRAARGWAAATRDELVLGPDQPEVLAALSALRDLGWHPATTLSAGEQPPQLQRLARLLHRLGPPRFPGQTLTLSGTARVASAVVLDASPEQLSRWQGLARELGCSLMADADFARLQVGEAAPVPSGAR